MDPEQYSFFEILDEVCDDYGDPVLLVREAAESEPTAAAVEEIFEAFGAVQIFVLPKEAEITRTTKARIAERAGINLGALATAQQQYQMLLRRPGQGHLTALGEALAQVYPD